MKHNASDSILKLPTEIRSLIWKAVLGERLIHIKYFSAVQLSVLQRHQTIPEATEDRGAFRRIECSATITETQAYNASKVPCTKVPNGENPQFYVQACKERHACCFTLADGTKGKRLWKKLFDQGDYVIDEKNRITMCTLLLTSVQIYAEAFQVLWKSNTFSFDDPCSLKEFVRSLTTHQKQSLVMLHVSQKTDYSYDS